MVMGMKGNKSKLDPKLCFELCARTGSARKAALVLKAEYGLYRENGTPYSGQGMWQASNRYVLLEPMAARKIFEEVWKANGVLVTDAVWYEYVLDKVNYLTPAKQKEYLAKHSYLTPYVKS